MADRKQSIGERLRDADARLGTIILIDAAHNGETASDALEAFIDDDIDDAHVQADLARDWPDFVRLYAVNTEADEDEDQDVDRSFRRSVILDLLQTHCPKPYLVAVEFTVKTLVKPGARYPLGTWHDGWGYYRTRWCLVDSVEEAVDRAIEYAEQQKREAWDAFVQAVEYGKRRRGGGKKGVTNG